MTKQLFWIPVIILLLLAGCTENVTNYYNNLETNGRVIGYVHGVVTDANTNARLDSVDVQWAVNGELMTTFTNNLGYYTISQLPPGYYEVTFFGHNNYAISRSMVTIPRLEELFVDDMPTEEDFDYSVTEDIDLYRLNAGATGMVYAQEDDDKEVDPDHHDFHIATRVTVIADFRELDISPDEYLTLTDMNGAFEFSNLPAATGANRVYFRTMPFADTSGSYATQEIGTNGLVYNGSKIIKDIFCEIDVPDPFVISNNIDNRDFGIDDNLVLTFSKQMVPTSFDITLETGERTEQIGFEATWSNNITLTINPYVTLQHNETYRLELDGLSQDDHRYNEVFEIDTEPGIEYVHSNIQEIESEDLRDFPINSNIEVTFNLPVNLNHPHSDFSLYDCVGTHDDTSDDILVSTAITVSGDAMTVILNPDYNLEYGTLYRQHFDVYPTSATADTDKDSGDIWFWTVSNETLPAQVTGLERVSGHGPYDYNRTDFWFMWNSVVNADHYLIFAKDNDKNTDLVHIGTVDADDHLDVIEMAEPVILPEQFDVFDDDAIQTPFADGVDVLFYVAAENEIGIGPYSNIAYGSDWQVPTLTGTTQTGGGGSADQTGEDAADILVTFYFSEYMDAETALNISVLEDGGDDEYVIPTSRIDYEWSSDRTFVIFTLHVPADANAAGDKLIITNFKDSSLNNATAETSHTLW
ncbi:Ig-like domain-containing protein [candidate division KSB1 bacterium]|nr:Ig-like domain-containing protein [candidate division KSB1 bacterium]